MSGDLIVQVRKLSQLYAYTSIKMHETVARKAGFSGTDHKYLGFILQKGQMTAGELADLTGLTTGAVTGLIDRFEKKKLVKRHFDENDRRKVVIIPDSERITALITPFYKDYQSCSEELIRSFSTPEIKTIETYFLKAIELMEKTTETIKEKTKDI
ncbi:MAG: MarR family winged helix-turn-helix transcriptional regulator [Puia sp.]|nr:MarR family winged helix-turn-helix transcriptional regulator [Puia sp.]